MKKYLKSFSSGNVKYRFIASRDKEDCEKMVLPAIVYINANHKTFADNRRKGFMICIGWWDWSIKFGVII